MLKLQSVIELTVALAPYNDGVMVQWMLDLNYDLFFFKKSVELLKKANLCRKFGKFACSFILSSQANETPVSCFDPATVLEHFHNSAIPKKHSNKQQQQQKFQFLRSPKLAEFHQLSSSKYCNINNN